MNKHGKAKINGKKMPTPLRVAEMIIRRRKQLEAVATWTPPKYRDRTSLKYIQRQKAKTNNEQ